MKITLEQLKRLIREATEDVDRVKPYSAAELLKALEDAPDEAFDDEPKEEGEEEDVEDYHDPRPGDFARRRLEEGAIRLVYTNHGILTEEHVRELKEYGYEMEECGSWEVEGPSMRTHHDEPVAKVVILGPGQEDVIEEGDTSSPSVGGSGPGTQVAVGMPSGPGGAPSPSGAAVVAERFNRHAEALLEAWLEEELHGDQDKLDLDDDGEIEASDLAMLRHGLTDKQVGEDRKRS